MNSLDAFLAAVSPPLTFLATASPDAAARTRVPGRAFAEQARAFLAQVTDARVRADLTALCDELRALEDSPPQDRRVRAERCRELIDRIRHGSPEEAPPYRRTAADLTEYFKVLSQSAQFVRGVGPRRAEQFKKFGIATVEDLLYHLPFRYEDRRLLVPLRALVVGEEQSAVGEIAGVREGFTGRVRRRIVEILVRDADSAVMLVFFQGVQYFARRFVRGQRVLVHGKVEAAVGGDRLRMVHPDVTPLQAGDDPSTSARVVPVYEKPTVWPAAAMRRIVHAAAREYADRVPSVLPAAIAARQRVIDLPRALRHVHDPAPEADLQSLHDAASLAHR